MQFIKGQGYDGDSAMPECVIGVAARIQSHFPKAVYVHCFSHKLNHAIVKSCDIL